MRRNIPNCISVFRILLAIAFILIFTSDYNSRNIISVIIFIVAGISDVVDGYLARKYKLESNFGKLIDPLADKLMQISVAICIATVDKGLFWVPVFLILKELFMVCGAAKLLKKDNVVVKANFFGKFATVIYFTIFLIIILFNDKLSVIVKQIMCMAFVASSVIAFINYVIEYIKFSTKNVSDS